MQNKKKAVVPLFIPKLSQYVTKNVTPTIILTKNPKVLYFCLIIVNLYHIKKWLIFPVSDSLNPVAIGSGYSAETISPLFSERKRELSNQENHFRVPSHVVYLQMTFQNRILCVSPLDFWPLKALLFNFFSLVLRTNIFRASWILESRNITIHLKILILGTWRMGKVFPIWILLFDWQSNNSKNRNTLVIILKACICIFLLMIFNDQGWCNTIKSSISLDKKLY